MVLASFVVTGADGGRQRISLRLSDGKYLVTPYPGADSPEIELPTCSGRRAWEAAKSAGVAPKHAVWISVQPYAPSPSGVVWNINDEGKSQPVMIDGKSCEVVFPRQ